MPISSAHLSWWQAVAQTGQNTPVSSRISRPRPFVVAHVSSDASLLWNKRLPRPVQKTSPPLGVANQVCPFRTSTSRSKCDLRTCRILEIARSEPRAGPHQTGKSSAGLGGCLDEESPQVRLPVHRCRQRTKGLRAITASKEPNHPAMSFVSQTHASCHGAWPGPIGRTTGPS